MRELRNWGENMSDNIYNEFNLSRAFPKYKKVHFFQACDWNKHSLIFKLHRKSKVISKKKALIDFEAFKFAVDNLYCGKPIHEKAGVNFEECYKLIGDYINKAEKLTTKDLCEKYAQAFNNKFVDNHFLFQLPTDKENPIRLPTRRNYLPYFTDIIVEQIGEEYYVVSTECENVKVGDIIKDTGCMFETLPQNKKRRFFVGVRSWEKRESIEIVCNNKTITVKLHLCRVAEREKQDIVFSHYRENEIDIIRSNTFNSISDKTTINDAGCLGAKLKDSKSIIFDMHHNGGGNSLYSEEFIRNLNGYCEENPYTSIELITALHKKIKDKKVKEWIIHSKNDINLEKASFNGEMIVLTDYYCASSAEETINFTKSLKNVIRVGTNTNGCNCFTNLWVCILPETYMAMFLPNVTFLDMFEEGKGFEPDYWLDTTEPLKEIISWLKNKL